MSWSGDSKDAERRYGAGRLDGRIDKREGRPYDEQGASSDDWIEGYWDGYTGRPDKYEVAALLEAATDLVSKKIGFKEFKAVVRAL